MKKDFEQAYKELAQNEAPDLWDRIEAGLSEKSTPESVKVRIQITKPAEQQKKREVLLYFVKYGTVVAALLCVVILIPVARTISFPKYYEGGSSSNTSAANTAQDTAGVSGGASKDGVLEASDESEAPAAQDDFTKYTQAMGDTETAAMAETPTMELAESENDGETAMDAGIAEDAKLKSSADSRGIDDKSMAAEMPGNLKRLKEDSIVAHVVIRVMEVNDTDLTEDINENGRLYSFLVEEESSGILTRGEQYVLFVPAFSSYAFMQGNVYEVDLCYREKDEYSFVLEKYHGEIVK